MKMNNLVPTVLTDKVDECKRFYMKHLGMKPVWDSDAYVALAADDPKRPFTIAFRTPMEGERAYAGGLSFNVSVESADREHARLTEAGLKVVRPLQDNPWGDRSFVVLDPAGVGLYVCHETQVAKELAQYVVA